jgi:hypothetical protein
MTGVKAMSETRLKNNNSMVFEYTKKGKLWIVAKMKCEKTVLSSFTKLIPEDLAEISK